MESWFKKRPFIYIYIYIYISKTGIKIDQCRIQILDLPDYLNVVFNTREDTERAVKFLEEGAKIIDLLLLLKKRKLWNYIIMRQT